MGVIVFRSELAGLHDLSGRVAYVPGGYGRLGEAIAWGLAMLIKQHALELAPHAINVNGVAPTFVYTEMIRHVMENPEFRDQLLERIPLGRIADPQDVVGPSLFFASPAADFVTGQILYVDGGITASQ